MSNSAKLAIAVAGMLTASLLTAAGHAATATAKRSVKRAEKGAAAKNETYAVVQVGDQMRVIRKSGLAALKKSTAEEDKRRRKAYDEEKRTAKGDDRADLGKPPVNRKVVVLKQPFKTEQEARDWLRQQDQGGPVVGSKKKKAY